MKIKESGQSIISYGGRVDVGLGFGVYVLGLLGLLRVDEIRVEGSGFHHDFLLEGRIKGLFWILVFRV